MSKTKFFCIAVEGDTCDGREISRQDIIDMAETYDPKTYGARVNMEHIRGFSAEPPFCAYGDVTALKTEEVTLKIGGKDKKLLGLFAQIDPTDELLAINKKRQKVYTSIEVRPNFANSGKAYLQGLAVTDGPASLGTDFLQFCAGQGDKSPLASRKQDPGNFFSAARETVIELDEAPADPFQSADARGFFAAATSFFKGIAASAPPENPPAPPVQDPSPANDNDVRFTAIASGMEQMAKGIEAMGVGFSSAVAEVKADVAKLSAAIETTDGDQHRRPPATGGKGNYARAEC